MTQKLPTVSVVMPIYNCTQFIEEAVESILAQTFTDFELLIIDNASPDGTADLVEAKFKDPRIRLIRNASNMGLVYSLNVGIREARGEFIARMDGDDRAHPHRLEKQLAWLKRYPEIDLCGTWFRYFGSSNVEMKMPVEHADILAYTLRYNPLGHPTVMYRKKVLERLKVPSYDPDFYPAEDYEFWTRILRVARASNIPEVLLEYRIHPHQISSSNQAQHEMTSVLRKKWAAWAFEWPALIPQEIWNDVSAALAGQALRLRKAIVVSGLFRLMHLTNKVIGRIPSKSLRQILREADPLNQHPGWLGKLRRKLA